LFDAVSGYSVPGLFLVLFPIFERACSMRLRSQCCCRFSIGNGEATGPPRRSRFSLELKLDLRTVAAA